MSSDSPDRRAFLTGQAAARSLREAGDRLAESVEATGPLQPILEVSRRAMACEFAVLQRADGDDRAADFAMEALDVVEQLEEQLTVYNETSEVSQLNLRASSQAVLVESNLLQLIQKSVAIWAETGGAFDVTAGPLSKLWGFYHRSAQLPDHDSIEPILNRVGSQYLDLDTLNETVRFARPAMEINFGAIGKGYALDQCGYLLQQHGVEDFLVHGGMSSMLARGTRSETQDAPGWRIAVRNPVTTQHRLIEITLNDVGLATSGSANQFFYFEGNRYSHIIDPRNGRPVQGTWSVTVVAPTATEADAYATALFVMGTEAGIEFCRQRTDLAAWILAPGDRSGALDLHVVGTAEIDWRLLSDDVTVRQW